MTRKTLISRPNPISRRQVLAAGAALSGGPALAAAPVIRPATADDLPALVRLLLQGARERRSTNPKLWALAPDAEARIWSGLDAALRTPLADQRWLVAEAAGRPVGAAHGRLLRAPPILQDDGKLTGLILEDGVFSAPVAQDLLEAMEAVLRAAGAALLVAACPARGPRRALLERNGYEPVTLYMAKHDLEVRPSPGVRPATPDDVPAIVRLNTRSLADLAALNPRFWRPHPEAATRFDRWMRTSLTLKDRDMFVAGPPADEYGYVIAQPSSPLHIPPGHDLSRSGLIDDFFDAAFADTAVLVGGARATALLAAAESALARRGADVAMAICPAAWTSKTQLLERSGYRAAMIWMLKR